MGMGRYGSEMQGQPSGFSHNTWTNSRGRGHVTPGGVRRILRRDLEQFIDTHRDFGWRNLTEHTELCGSPSDGCPADSGSVPF